MTTPFDCSPRPATYSATAWAQRRTFWNVKSSATLARQPSVPKTIWAGWSGEAGVSCDGDGVVVMRLPPGPRASCRGFGCGRTGHPPSKLLGDLTNVLRPIRGANEQRFGGVYHDHVAQRSAEHT